MTTTTTTVADLVGFAPAAKNERLRKEFAVLPGFEWTSADRAHVKIDDQIALLTFDAAEDVRFALPVAAAIDPIAALQRCAGLPVNLRFALDKRQLRLVADIRGEDFAGVFREVVGAARRAASGKQTKRRSRAANLDKQAVAEALRELPQRDESLVELADGWEYRPRVSGRPVAVKLNLAGKHLRCHRTVEIPSRAPLSDSAAIEALRFNLQFKHARLVVVESRIVAEAHLPGAMLQPQSLAVALRAVALAERRARTSLTILTGDERIAAAYADTFGGFESNRKKA